MREDSFEKRKQCSLQVTRLELRLLSLLSMFAFWSLVYSIFKVAIVEIAMIVINTSTKGFVERLTIQYRNNKKRYVDDQKEFFFGKVRWRGYTVPVVSGAANKRRSVN